MLLPTRMLGGAQVRDGVGAYIHIYAYIYIYNAYLGGAQVGDGVGAGARLPAQVQTANHPPRREARHHLAVECVLLL